MITIRLAAAMLAMATVAADANPIVTVVTPARYTDGTELPVAKRFAARVYCGPTAGRYVQAWEVESTADVVTVPLTGLRRASYCARTYISRAPDSDDLRESDFGVEFPLRPMTAEIPLDGTTTWQQPAVCTTTCTVNRTR